MCNQPEGAGLNLTRTSAIEDRLQRGPSLGEQCRQLRRHPQHRVGDGVDERAANAVLVVGTVNGRHPPRGEVRVETGGQSLIKAKRIDP